MTTRYVKPLLRVGALLVALLLAGIWLGTRGPESEQMLARKGTPVVPTVAVLDSSLRALADGEQESSRDGWDTEWLARRLGGDPETILAWVRGETSWIPYHGSLRGARGVLQDRQGNSLDRSLLLARLLEHSGHTVRLAHADLGAAPALEVLPALVGRRRVAHVASVAAATADGAWRPVVRQVAMRYGLDPDGVEGTLAAGVDANDHALATLDRRVEDQFQRLQRLMPARPKAEPRSRVDSAVSALRDHWWVQRFDGSRWVDLDPLRGGRDAVAAVPATRTLETRSVPDSMFHQVTVRLVTEGWSRNGLRERVALESDLRLSELAGVPISLQIWPTRWPAEVLPAGTDPRAAVRDTALAQNEWRALLMVGNAPRADVVLDVRGDMRAAAAGGPMGALGQGIANALAGDREDADVFTAAWLDYETRVPGRNPRHERRVLFDLVGPAARAAGLAQRPQFDNEKRLTRQFALMRQTEILALGSVPDPAFVLHLAAEATRANMLLLRTRLADTALQRSDSFEDVAQRIAPPPSPLYTLAMMRFEGDRGGDVFLDQPNVLSRHLWLRPVEGGAIRAEANDIVLNDVGVAVDLADDVAARLRQGIRDTNAESLFPVGARARESVGLAFSTPGEWVVATSASDPSLRAVRATDDTRLRMQEDLEAGYVLIVPRSAPNELVGDISGWWRIDPSTGDALGVSRIGWGQTLFERAVLAAGAFSAAWAFEHLICREGLYGLPGEPGARTDGTVGFLQPKAAYAQTRFCSINALIAGILALGAEVASATWPLVIRTVFGPNYQGWLNGGKSIGQSIMGTGARGGSASPGTGAGSRAPLECPGPSTSGPRASPNEPLPNAGPRPAEPAPGAAPSPSEPAPNAGPRPGEPSPAGEPSAPATGSEPASSRWPRPNMEWEPYDPAYVEQQRMLARDEANEAEQAFQEALTAYRKAASDAPPTTDHVIAEGKLSTASAQRAAARDKQLKWERLGPVNDELAAARSAMAQAQREMQAQLNSGRGFEGPVYDRWSAATQRLQNAERAFSNANFGRNPSSGASRGLPPASQGETRVIPNSPEPVPSDPALANTEAASGSTPGGCGGSQGRGGGSGGAPPSNLSRLRQQVQEANEQYEAAIENFYKYEQQFEEAEKLAVQAGQPTPEHPEGYRQALNAKINAIQQRDWARLKFQEAGGRLDSWGRPLDPAPGATSMVGMAGGAGRK